MINLLTRDIDWLEFCWITCFASERIAFEQFLNNLSISSFNVNSKISELFLKFKMNPLIMARNRVLDCSQHLLENIWVSLNSWNSVNLLNYLSTRVYRFKNWIGELFYVFEWDLKNLSANIELKMLAIFLNCCLFLIITLTIRVS